jgi:hypothetical protein
MPLWIAKLQRRHWRAEQEDASVCAAGEKENTVQLTIDRFLSKR